MASTGENQIREIMMLQGYNLEEVGNEDVFGFKANLGVVVDDKDWKDPVKVERGKIYQRGINGRWYYHNRSQVIKYAYNITKRDIEKGIYKFIICAYVFSNLMGRRVQPIKFRKFGTIFVVSREYFPLWLKSLERTYLGETSFEDSKYYLGGK